MNKPRPIGDIAQIYKSLSEEIRLRILMLLTHGELCVCDLMAVLDEPQSKVSRHIAYLKNSGFVNGRRVGTWMHYSLKEPLEGILASHVEFLQHEFSRVDWAKGDEAKMKEVQAKKLCEQPGKKARRR